MSQTPPNASTQNIRSRDWSLAVGVLAATLLCVVLGENIEQLILGWLYFPLRTIPQAQSVRYLSSSDCTG